MLRFPVNSLAAPLEAFLREVRQSPGQSLRMPIKLDLGGANEARHAVFLFTARPLDRRVRPADNLANSTTERKAALTDAESGKDLTRSESTSTGFDPSTFRQWA